MGLENLFELPFFSYYTPIQLFCELLGQQFISLTNTPPRCTDGLTVVFLASGQYTLSIRTYAPFRNVVRSNQRRDSGDEVKFKTL